MYKFVPQKKRSDFRIKCGMLLFCTLRRLEWVKNSEKYASLKKSRKFLKSKGEGDSKILQEKAFPFIAFEHSTPLFRNLSGSDILLEQNKVCNLSIAASLLDGLILEKGKIFSYWKCIGKPSKSRGFKEGLVLKSGRLSSGIGGGLCQASNLLYWMTLHTPLVVTQRWRHSYDVFPDSSRTQPFGSGATCVYNYRDLQIKNETDQAFLLKVWIQDGKLCGQWRTQRPLADKYEVYEKKHWITMEMAGVYVRHNVLSRRHFVPSANDGNVAHAFGEDFSKTFDEKACFSEENDFPKTFDEKKAAPSDLSHGAKGENLVLAEDVEIAFNDAIMMYNPLLSEKGQE